MERSSRKEYILIDVTNGERKTFKSLKDISSYINYDRSNISAAARKGTTISKRWKVKKVIPPYEIEVWKPRLENFDYQARRRAILRTLKTYNTEGIVVVDESSRHNTSYWNIFMKNPSEDLIKRVNEMIEWA